MIDTCIKNEQTLSFSQSVSYFVMISGSNQYQSILESENENNTHI